MSVIDDNERQEGMIISSLVNSYLAIEYNLI